MASKHLLSRKETSMKSYLNITLSSIIEAKYAMIQKEIKLDRFSLF